MEKLSARLDACQDNLLTLIEKNSSDLADQIKYWNEVKVENLLLFAAKKKGLNRLGFQPVPSTKISEAKAKEAILMALSLTSLQKSKFGAESWTLPQTSAEMFMAAPKHTFKKAGQQIEVHYDGQAEKAVPYVQWGEIYVQDEQDMWHKTKGDLDYYGLSYIDPVIGRVYYVLFSSESNTYGDSKPWVVHTNDGTLSSHSTSASPPNTTTERPPARNPECTPEARLSFWGSPGTGQRPTTGSACSGVSARTPYQQPPCVLGGRRISRSGSGFGGRRRRRTIPLRHPGEIGEGSGQSEGQNKRGVGQTPEANCQNPVLIFQGPSNRLKCWRYRCNKGYRDFFHNFSSVFCMLTGESGRGNDSRVLVTFNSYDQLTLFKEKVPIPKNVGLSSGLLSILH